MHIELSLYALVIRHGHFRAAGRAGLALARRPRFGRIRVSVRVIPSISVLFLLYPYRRDIGQFAPFWDRNFVLALIALTLLAGPPLIINTDAALRGVAPSVLENAQGLGMTGPQVFAQVSNFRSRCRS